MNADWAKGRNERTHQEGIFPRGYVTIVEEKSNSHGIAPPPTPQRETNYGNMPVAVSQTGGGGGGGAPSKVEENGKKFGKKLGNAGTCHMLHLPIYVPFVSLRVPDWFVAIFGAGATIGSNIVNGIF